MLKNKCAIARIPSAVVRTSTIASILSQRGVELVLYSLTLDEWQALVESHPDSTVFHHRNWIELISHQYAARYHIPALKQERHIVAATPFVEVKGRWGKRKLISLPFTDCVPVLATQHTGKADLRKSIVSEWSPHNKVVVIRTDRPVAGTSSASTWIRHELSTSQAFAALENNFTSNAKNNVRKAAACNLKFARRVDIESMAAFYKLQLKTRRKLGMPVQPKRFFELFYDRIIAQRLGFIGLVLQDRSVIAAAIILTFNKTMTYKYLASDPSALKYRPNDFLTYNAIRCAVEGGYSRFDFGVSKRDQTGLRRFKQKWGAREIDVYHDYLTGKIDTPIDQSPALRMASVAIRRSPTIVCRAMGELFYQYSQ